MNTNKSNFIYIVPHPLLEDKLPEYLRPSEPTRNWFEPHFYHCLPLGMANTLGWTLYSPYKFSVSWNGSLQKGDLVVKTESDGWPVSWFGYGIFTIIPHFFVRTSTGINLLIKPVPNYFKRGVSPLEGLVETDWFQGGFTLNFKITEPNTEITYEVGDPLIQLLVYPRSFIENFDAQIKLDGDFYHTSNKEMGDWIEKRTEILENFTGHNRDFSYMRGEDINGVKFEEHQKKIQINPFRENED